NTGRNDKTKRASAYFVRYEQLWKMLDNQSQNRLETQCNRNEIRL
ncbi:unnamed protein product, partial [marine sediment metagenome]